MKGRRASAKLAWILSSAGLVAAAQPALAQFADGAGDADIVVTAQRRAERVQDVPISITTVSGDQLDARGARQLVDIETITPGLTFLRNGPFTQPVVRGVGTAISTPVGGSNVGLYVDGFYSPNPMTMNMHLLNIANIEVLKGPQGTLFGRNTTGGAILVSTTEPSTTPGGRVLITYGSRNEQSYQAYATTGIDEKIAFDIAAAYDKGDGWQHNIVTGRKDSRHSAFSIRTSLKFDLTDNFSAILRYAHMRMDDPRATLLNAYCCNAQGKAYALAAYIPGAVVATKPNELSSTLSDPGIVALSDAYQMKLKLDLDWGTIESFTQYRDESGSPRSYLDQGSSIPLFAVDYTYYDRIFTQELLINSRKSGRLQWTAGAFYFLDNGPVSTDASAGGAPFINLIKTHAKVESLAGYFDATYEVGDRLFLTGGIRVAHDRYKDAGDILGPFFLPIFGLPAERPYPSISRTKATPRAVVRYALDSRSSVYASFAQGYKSALRNLSSVVDTTEVRPEEITAYEVGYKFGSRALSFSVAGYYYDYKNLQVSAQHGAIAIINNAARSRVYGLEADARYVVSPAFEISAGAAYTNARYRSYHEAPTYGQCLDPAICPGGVGGTPSKGVDIENSPMQQSPKFKGNVSARYTTALAAGRLSASATLAYTSKTYFDVAALYANKGHEDLGARIEWTDPSDKLTLAIFGNNLTNARYYILLAPSDMGVSALWNEPRSINGSVSYHF